MRTEIDERGPGPRDSSMRRPTWILLVAFVAAGCRHGGNTHPVTPNEPVTLRPLDGSVGKVTRINPRLKFVVLDYSLNRIPNLGTSLKLYRGTEIVGELRLNGPVENRTAAADIVSGTPQIGDRAREE